MGAPSMESRIRWFMRRVRFDASGCWLWEGKVRPAMGRSTERPLARVNGKDEYAYRFVFSLCYGRIPRGLFICHKCDVPTCVNPAHLFVGSSWDNMQDMIRKGRARHPLGEKSGAAKLTEAAVLEIRRTYVRGRRSRTNTVELARLHGVDSSVISRIVNGKSWQHIHGAQK